MEPEGSLPHSQQPATCPCPEPDQSSQCISSRLLEGAVRVSASTSWATVGSKTDTPLYGISFNVLVLVACTGHCAGGNG